MTAKPSATVEAIPDAGRIIAELVPFLHIAHQIPGRVRLKISAATHDVQSVLRDHQADHKISWRQALAALKTLPGVRDISVNPLARSCIVTYDSAIIPDTAWPDLVAGRKTPAAATLLGILADNTASVLRTSRRKENKQ